MRGPVAAPRRTQFWLTTAEAREKLGVNESEFNKLVRRNKFRRTRAGYRWMINAEDVKTYYLEGMKNDAMRPQQPRAVLRSGPDAGGARRYRAPGALPV